MDPDVHIFGTFMRPVKRKFYLSFVFSELVTNVRLQ
jgi:hypothetical protein